MPRFLAFAIVIIISIISSSVGAQNSGQLQAGDPPTASLIDISVPDENGIVTLTGAPGAVFAGAQVAIRNLFTEQLTYTQAGLNGAFTARIFGPGRTPFWVSPATSIPPLLRDRPGSMPGGPGTIIYGNVAEAAPATTPITQLVIDGEVNDWLAYPAARLLKIEDATIYGMRNVESIYIGLGSAIIPQDYSKLHVFFTLEGATYRLSLDPRLSEEVALLNDISPVERDRGAVGVAKAQAEFIELRIPLRPLRSTLGAAVEAATLDRLEFVAADDSVLVAVPVLQELPPVDEIDGIMYETTLDNPVRFSVSGPVAQGASVWLAQGRANRLNFMPGEALRLQFDVTMTAPDFPESLDGISMIGVIGLQPISGPDGSLVSGGLNSNNGWSAILTPGGLPVDNLRSDFVLGEAVAPAPRMVRRDDELIFGLDFDLMLPEDLPEGRYNLTFQGFGQISDGERFSWQSNGLLGSGPGISRVARTRLPLVLTLGEPAISRLIWTLFQDDPSDGSRGVLAEQDQGRAALSNRVRFNSPTYILPPFTRPSGDLKTYPLEPYLVSQMPNAFDSTAAPLVPLRLPGGQITARVTRPDGMTDDLERTTILQSRLSTSAQDERSRFGGQSQVDVFRLTTLESAYTRYPFDQYGPYTIELSGSVNDIWGNEYTGGGTYRVLIAELLDMQTGVLPGAPFIVGDSFQAGLTVAPGVAADVTISARIFPVDGSAVIEHEISGKANRFGYFSGESFTFTTPGEYIIDYEARFTDSEGRLWAGSTRSAGVIANADGALVAHGRRGLNQLTDSDFRPAWFTTRKYGSPDAVFHLNYPYHAGDVLWYVAGGSNTITPGITVQDTGGDYAAWIANVLADQTTADGRTIEQQAIRGELPVIETDKFAGDLYTYLSVDRPGITVRQYVLGADDNSLPLYWDMADPYNAQIGSGLKGDLLGDYVFLFGGAVIRNEAAAIAETAVFAATAFATEDGFEAPGARVYPPYRGAAGGADGGPLIALSGNPVTMFFYPTGIQPGQVLTVGDTLSIAGHVAPALASEVRINLTSPSGEQQSFSGVASSVGYFYDPKHDVVVDEPGIWTVEIETRHTGLTSAGAVGEPYPQGGVLGVDENAFAIYVVRENEPLLTWNDTRQDIVIPGAIPVNFNFDLPEGWLDPTVHHTVTIPGYIARSGPLNTSGASFSFQYNPTNLNAALPNFEVDARLDGPAASDPVSMTFAVTDTNGQIRVRTFTIFYDRLLTLES